MFLLKIFDVINYAEEFINGHIRVMPVSTYREIADEARKDIKESTKTPVIIKPELDVPVQSLNFPGTAMCLDIKALQEDLKATGYKLSIDDLLIASLPLDPYVLCMSVIPQNQNDTLTFLTDIFSNNRKGSFGVLVRGEDLVEHIRHEQKAHPELCDMLGGAISYIAENVQSNNIFEKSRDFAYEHEYRFVFPHITKKFEEKPDYFIDIGPLPGVVFSVLNDGLRIMRNTFVQEPKKPWPQF